MLHLLIGVPNMIWFTSTSGFCRDFSVYHAHLGGLENVTLGLQKVTGFFLMGEDRFRSCFTELSQQQGSSLPGVSYFIRTALDQSLSLFFLFSCCCCSSCFRPSCSSSSCSLILLTPLPSSSPLLQLTALFLSLLLKLVVLVVPSSSLLLPLFFLFISFIFL